MKRPIRSALSKASEKHLSSYAASALAGASVLTAAQVAQAGILSFTYGPQVLAPASNSVATFQLFTNGPTLRLSKMRSITSTISTGATNSHGLSLVANGAYALNLAAGAAISAGRGFVAANNRVIGYAYGSRFGGNFNGQAAGYLGFKFNDPTTPSRTDYGWVRISENASETSLTIIAAGYDNTGQMINAGQTVAAVPEPGSLGLLAGGAGCLAAWRLRRAKRRPATGADGGAALAA